MSLQELLRTHQDAIVTAFVRGVRSKDLPPEGLSGSALVDHIPIFLQEIAGELARGAGIRNSLDALEVVASAEQHGEQRWEVGYDLEAVVREYNVLRQAIFEVAESEHIQLSTPELDVLLTYLGVGVAGAAAQYVSASEERLKARQADLELLSEAGERLSSSLDSHSTLARLTGLLVPRLADFCVVHLDGNSPTETPVAHVDPEKAELIRELMRRFPEATRDYSHAKIVREGEPVLVPSAPAQLLQQMATCPEHLELLQRIAPSSWIGVPLKIKNNLLGSITLGWSESERRYTAADLLLAQELARRAAAAIDNARLYELSREERARAEAATRTKDEFVAMVSHELRTPLNVIIGWVRLLRAGSLPEATREQALEVVERNANAQSQLVADLLDISRAITGKIRLDPAQVDFRDLVRMVLEDARFAHEVKRLKLHVDLPSEATIMRGDAERLKQVVWNLLLNAIKFTPKGGDIWVTLRTVESDLELTVRDSGVGIESEFLPHVFDSFRQSDSKTTRSHSGLGIGLSIAKHLVDLHGGTVQARSKGPGLGASFTVRLPVSPLISTTVGVTRVPATSPRKNDLARPEVLADLSILVVDDEEDARDLLRIVLESCGVRVHDAGSAREGLSKLGSEPIDLIISDIGMPEEDGYTFIRNVRSLGVKEKAGVPAVALTAFARNEDRTRALLEGFNVHMAKPVEPAELLITLADLSAHVVRKSPPGGVRS